MTAKLDKTDNKNLNNLIAGMLTDLPKIVITEAQNKKLEALVVGYVNSASIAENYPELSKLNMKALDKVWGDCFKVENTCSKPEECSKDAMPTFTETYGNEVFKVRPKYCSATMDNMYEYNVYECNKTKYMVALLSGPTVYCKSYFEPRK